MRGVPEGYRLVKTDEVVPENSVDFYPFRWAAERRRNELEAVRKSNGGLPSYRWEVEKVPRRGVARLRRDGKIARWWPWTLWAVVPMQNRLEKV